MRKKLLYPGIAFTGVLLIHAVYSIWQTAEISHRWVQIKEATPLVQYLQSQEYFLSFSYALASAFTIYALVSFLQNRKSGSGLLGVVGGATITGFLYFAGCFLLGCCGSPMLVVYLSLFGSSFLGVTKPLTAMLTLASAIIGIAWIERRAKTIACCADKESCNGRPRTIGENLEVNEATTNDREPLSAIQLELSNGMELPKCRKCGCMKETLEGLQSTLPSLKIENALELSDHIARWHKQMEPIKYACLGCEYCFPAVAMNIFHKAFPESRETQALTCAFEVNEHDWPAVPGEYHAFCDGPRCPVAVSTLASVELTERLASIRPRELCIVGKTETENIGIDKIVKNTVTNPTIRFLLLAGKSPKGHYSGETLLSLVENGVDESMKVIGSPGRRPILRNVTREEVEAFRKQVQVVDMIGCEEEERIIKELKQIYQRFDPSCSCEESREIIRPVRITEVPIIHAEHSAKIEMDKSGYFVILPQPEKQIILAEHYSYDNTLLRVIDGKDARSIYLTIIRNGWATQLSHAAYLGNELAKAELSIKLGIKYIQDGA